MQVEYQQRHHPRMGGPMLGPPAPPQRYSSLHATNYRPQENRLQTARSSESSSLRSAATSFDSRRSSGDSAKPRLNRDQHGFLERCFNSQNKPSTATKKTYAEQLNVPLDKVNNWFQNRRAKVKHEIKRAQNQQNPQMGFDDYNTNTNNTSSMMPAYPQQRMAQPYDYYQNVPPPPPHYMSHQGPQPGPEFPPDAFVDPMITAGPMGPVVGVFPLDQNHIYHSDGDSTLAGLGIGSPTSEHDQREFMNEFHPNEAMYSIAEEAEDHEGGSPSKNVGRPNMVATGRRVQDSTSFNEFQATELDPALLTFDSLDNSPETMMPHAWGQGFMEHAMQQPQHFDFSIPFRNHDHLSSDGSIMAFNAFHPQGPMYGMEPMPTVMSRSERSFSGREHQNKPNDHYPIGRKTDSPHDDDSVLDFGFGPGTLRRTESTLSNFTAEHPLHRRESNISNLANDVGTLDMHHMPAHDVVVPATRPSASIGGSVRKAKPAPLRTGQRTSSYSGTTAPSPRHMHSVEKLRSAKSASHLSSGRVQKTSKVPLRSPASATFREADIEKALQSSRSLTSLQSNRPFRREDIPSVPMTPSEFRDPYPSHNAFAAAMDADHSPESETQVPPSSWALCGQDGFFQAQGAYPYSGTMMLEDIHMPTIPSENNFRSPEDQKFQGMEDISSRSMPRGLMTQWDSRASAKSPSSPTPVSYQFQTWQPGEDMKVPESKKAPRTRDTSTKYESYQFVPHDPTGFHRSSPMATWSPGRS